MSITIRLVCLAEYSSSQSSLSLPPSQHNRCQKEQSFLRTKAALSYHSQSKPAAPKQPYPSYSLLSFVGQCVEIGYGTNTRKINVQINTYSSTFSFLNSLKWIQRRATASRAWKATSNKQKGKGGSKTLLLNTAKHLD